MHQQLNMLVTHLTGAQLEAGLDDIRRSPKDAGELKLIVRRPRVNEREVLEEAQLDLIDGLAGDTWKYRASSRSADKASPHPDMQIAVNSPVGRALSLRGINARVVQAGAIRRGDIARKL